VSNAQPAATYFAPPRTWPWWGRSRSSSGRTGGFLADDSYGVGWVPFGIASARWSTCCSLFGTVIRESRRRALQTAQVDHVLPLGR